MIPKTIHYCWFGRNPKPELAIKCMASWRKYCPDYDIIEWKEDNFDLASAPIYVRQAYEAKKWAFVTDYVRLQVVYENGGIYLDTDVELLKNLDFLLDCYMFAGFENERTVATGLGFGGEKGCAILKEMMNEYDGISFIKQDGSFDLTPCPKRNTDILLKYGLEQNGRHQTLSGEICIFPMEYFCPIDFTTGKMHKTRNTVSIHWFSASWHSEAERERVQAHQEKQRKIQRRYIMTHWPLLLLRNIIGMDRYLKVRAFLRGEKAKR